MNKLLSLTLLSLFSLIVFIPQYSLNAQVVTEPISLTKSVSNTTPGQTVKINASSYKVDLDSSTLVWKIDNKEVKRGVGQTSIETTAPSIGKTKVVSVAAVSQGGDVFSGNITLDSNSVDIILENGGYVHPFFMGKVPVSNQAPYKVIAIPHIFDSTGKEIDANSLIYTWKVDGNIEVDASGNGKNYINLVGSAITSPVSLDYSIKTRDSRYNLSGNKIITFAKPSVKLYSNDPLYGPLFNLQLPSIKYLDKQNELGILAVPYGFDKPINNVGNLIFGWIIDGSTKTNLTANESIIVRAPEGTSGKSDISLQVNNRAKISQVAKSAFSVSFRQQDNANTSL